MRSTVITDASFCHRTQAAGWAAWIRVDGEAEAIRYSGTFEKSRPDNPTRAELFASLNGIWIASKYGATDVLLQTDCMAVIHAASGRGSLAPLWRKKLEEFGLSTLQIRCKHVKGHTNRAEPRYYVNRWCDEAAGRHMRTERACRNNQK